ncbi:MAG: type II secretion system F family protein [Candidatus Levybacteria bacterium]|nr:type II secretion system F family protein [Candidatus Levybacteria bacterium]
MKYNYKAFAKNGQVTTGYLEAKSTQDAAMILRNQQLSPIKISEQTISPINLFNKKGSFSSKELIFFTRQLSTMISSGLTLMQALRILRDQMSRPSAKELVDKIVADIEGGSSLSEAIQKYPTVFSQIYVSLVRASESSGLLDKITDRLAINLEKSAALKAQIISALTYPAIIILMMVGVVGIMVLFVIPQISKLYESLTIELPWSTKFLLGVSYFATNFWFIGIGMVVGAVVGFRYLYKRPTSRFVIDSMLLKIPLFGKLFTETVFTEFTRTFALLVGSGNVVVGSMKQAGDVVGNMVYKTEFNTAAERVEKGVTIGDALSASSRFPPYLVQIVKIGEQTGKLDDSLMRASEYYEKEVEQTVKTLTTAMEPLIMVILGIGVGFLLFSVITPIYKITSSI